MDAAVEAAPFRWRDFGGVWYMEPSRVGEGRPVGVAKLYLPVTPLIPVLTHVMPCSATRLYQDAAESLLTID